MCCGSCMHPYQHLHTRAHWIFFRVYIICCYYLKMLSVIRVQLLWLGRHSAKGVRALLLYNVSKETTLGREPTVQTVPKSRFNEYACTLVIRINKKNKFDTGWWRWGSGLDHAMRSRHKCGCRCVGNRCVVWVCGITVSRVYQYQSFPRHNYNWPLSQFSCPRAEHNSKMPCEHTAPVASRRCQKYVGWRTLGRPMSSMLTWNTM